MNNGLVKDSNLAKSLAKRDNYALSKDEWQMLGEIASTLVASGYLPDNVKTKAQAVSIMLRARELDIPPLYAFGQVYVVNGKTAMQGSLMLALIRRSGLAKFIKFDETEDGVTVTTQRNDEEIEHSFTWDRKRAQKAGLLNKGIWQKYEKTMMRWRCVSEMAKVVYSEIGFGQCYLPEEVEEIVEQEQPPVIVSAEITEEKPKIDTPKAEPKPVVEEPSIIEAAVEAEKEEPVVEVPETEVVTKEEPPAEPVKKKRKPRSDKGKKRGPRKRNGTPKPEPEPEPEVKTCPQDEPIEEEPITEALPPFKMTEELRQEVEGAASIDELHDIYGRFAMQGYDQDELQELVDACSARIAELSEE